MAAAAAVPCPDTMLRLFFTIAALLVAQAALGAEETPTVRVADPFVEFHSGPGEGYPVFFVVERGGEIVILKRKTDWFRVRSGGGQEGWVSREQLVRTLSLEGRPLRFSDLQLEDFSRRRWEGGVMGGDLEGANALTAYGSFAFTPGLSAEAAVTQGIGNYSTLWLANLSLLSQPFPDWRFSPYFAIGAGAVYVVPSATLVDAPDRLDAAGHVAVGLRTYLTRRFILRIDAREYLVFTSRDDNEDLIQWQVGFSFFF